MMKSFPERKWLLLLTALGVVTSLILLYHHVALNFGYQTEPSFCSISAYLNCDLVAKSSFSTLMGIPVPTLALFYYSLLFSLLALVYPRIESDVLVIKNIVLFFTFCALVPSFFLLYVTIFLIKSGCMFCIILDLLNIILAIISFRMRESGITQAVISIWKFFFSDLFSLQVSTTVRCKRVSLFLGIMLIWFIISGFPDLLKKYHFDKLQRSEQEHELVLEVLKEWQKTPSVEFSFPPQTNQQGVRDFYRGLQNAPVTIVEFSDFECPSCKKMSPILKQIEKEFEGKVKIIFKNFPLDQSCNTYLAHPIHQFSCQAAFVARCAGAQGRFWQMHDAIFALESLGLKELEELPSIVGLNAEEFTKCLADENAFAPVLDDIENGFKLGLTGTPSIFVNGKKVAYPSYATITEIIQNLLPSES